MTTMLCVCCAAARGIDMETQRSSARTANTMDPLHSTPQHTTPHIRFRDWLCVCVRRVCVFLCALCVCVGVRGGGLVEVVMMGMLCV